MSKAKHIKHIILAVLLLFAMIFPLLLLFSCGVVSHKADLPILYGALEDADDYDPDILAPGIMSVMKSRLLADIALTSDASSIKKSKTTVTLVASAYETPEKRGDDGKRSTLFNAYDQLLYGRTLVVMHRKRDFYKWMRDFEAAYKCDESSFHDAWLRVEDADYSDTTTSSSPHVVLRGEAHWSVTLAYTRALLEAWRLWGGREIEVAIAEASDALLPIFEEKKTDQPLRAGAQLPLALDVWEEPWPLPDENIVRMGTLISEIDLWTLLSLSRFEPKWAPITTHWIALAKNAPHESDLPLMAPVVHATTQEYIALRDGEQVIYLREQLTMALHLAEVGVSDDAFLSMIRSTLRDCKRLPVGWNILNSAPLLMEAMPCDYALAMRLGRAVCDQQLVEDAQEALLCYRVNSQSSEIFGGFFHSGSTPYTSTMTAIDNASAVLALR